MERVARQGVVLLCAGRGSRMAGAVEDKVLVPLAGRTAFGWSLGAFLESGEVVEVVVVDRDEEQRERLKAEVAGMGVEKLGVEVKFVRGGAERAESVWCGLEALGEETEFVFIHDAARPLVEAAWVVALGKMVREDGAACLARRVVDTIKRVAGSEGEQRRCALEDLDRSRLWAMETPQAFNRKVIGRAYARAREEGRRLTDDAAAVEGEGIRVSLLESPGRNLKLTEAGDVALAEFFLRERSQAHAFSTEVRLPTDG